MGWEQRGTNKYYYRKERSGAKVKSVYVGRGEIANLISNFESHSADLEKLMKAKSSIEANELERVEATLDQRSNSLNSSPRQHCLLPVFTLTTGNGDVNAMAVDFEKVITDKAEETRTKFRALLDKTNKEHPTPKDIKALSELLSGNRKLELWRDVVSAGHLAELMVIDNARATAAVKECWKQRLQALKKDLGYDGAPMLEQLLIQQAALCWLKLNLLELSYSGTMPYFTSNQRTKRVVEKPELSTANFRLN